ncbi:hypothetical protein IB236_22110 [Acidovorax sp. ACV02]|jgi:hypothetical protein|uniref:hypothetical protein n=1 Tax=Acidovorax sp. ACV02 TaxID=2769310 RepID=UPI001786011F|nr:hypothetical protein [Acidovorax sp. ACV02]MBD9408037.1 hypothetical protein [Acidovorax sp. ACV02]
MDASDALQQKNNSNKSNADERKGRFIFAFHMPERPLREKQKAENSLNARGIFWLTVRNGAIYDAPTRQRKKPKETYEHNEHQRNALQCCSSRWPCH